MTKSSKFRTLASRWLKWSVGVLGVGGVALGATFYFAPQTRWPLVLWLIRAQFPHAKQVETKTLAKWLQDPSEKILLLDIRKPEEYQVSHLPNAIHVLPKSDVSEAIKHIKQHKPTKIVLYCSIGYRSAKYVERLRGAGIQQVYNLEGSIFRWANEGRVLKKGDKDVHKVHPYNPQWGEMLSKSYR